MSYSIKFRAPVKLPPLSTEVKGMEYSMLSFLSEWVVSAITTDESAMPCRFEFEDAIEAFGNEMAVKASVTIPEDGSPAADFEAYRAAVIKAMAGESLVVSDESFETAKKEAKRAIDARIQSQSLPAPWHSGILRMYHSFAQSTKVADDVRDNN